MRERNRERQKERERVKESKNETEAAKERAKKEPWMQKKELMYFMVNKNSHFSSQNLSIS